MRKLFGLMIVLGLAATPAFAQKVNIDYAHDYDFESLKTFQYVDTEESNAQNPLMHDRIVAMIKQELREGGGVEVTENPDVYITYHVTTAERKSYSTTNYGYGGYHGGWYGWGGGMGSSTTQEHNYTEGTLIIDAYDAKEKKMIWRGTGAVTVKAKPEKQINQVNNILTKLGNRWDKILAGKGK
jgi:hypothetical protein